jgi:hypothetical protein
MVSDDLGLPPSFRYLVEAGTLVHALAARIDKKQAAQLDAAATAEQATALGAFLEQEVVSDIVMLLLAATDEPLRDKEKEAKGMEALEAALRDVVLDLIKAMTLGGMAPVQALCDNVAKWLPSEVHCL